MKSKQALNRHRGARPRRFAQGEKEIVKLDKMRRAQANFVRAFGWALAQLDIGGKVVRRHLDQTWKRFMEDVFAVRVQPPRASKTRTVHSVFAAASGSRPGRRCCALYVQAQSAAILAQRILRISFPPCPSLIPASVISILT